MDHCFPRLKNYPLWIAATLNLDVGRRDRKLNVLKYMTAKGTEERFWQFSNS
jgi:hypothetical protein